MLGIVVCGLSASRGERKEGCWGQGSGAVTALNAAHTNRQSRSDPHCMQAEHLIVTHAENQKIKLPTDCFVQLA